MISILSLLRLYYLLFMNLILNILFYTKIFYPNRKLYILLYPKINCRRGKGFILFFLLQPNTLLQIPPQDIREGITKEKRD